MRRELSVAEGVAWWMKAMGVEMRAVGRCVVGLEMGWYIDGCVGPVCGKGLELNNVIRLRTHHLSTCVGCRACESVQP
jgi:hypothetical protein